MPRFFAQGVIMPSDIAMVTVYEQDEKGTNYRKTAIILLGALAALQMGRVRLDVEQVSGAGIALLGVQGQEGVDLGRQLLLAGRHHAQ